VHAGVPNTRDQPVADQSAQGEGEHPLADPLDGAVQFAELVRALAEQDDNQDAPLSC
jgi:hypothetical protein